MLGSDGKFFMATNAVASVVIYLFYAYVAPNIPEYSDIVKVKLPHAMARLHISNMHIPRYGTLHNDRLTD